MGVLDFIYSMNRGYRNISFLLFCSFFRISCTLLLHPFSRGLLYREWCLCISHFLQRKKHCISSSPIFIRIRWNRTSSEVLPYLSSTSRSKREKTRFAWWLTRHSTSETLIDIRSRIIHKLSAFVNTAQAWGRHHLKIPTLYLPSRFSPNRSHSGWLWGN